MVVKYFLLLLIAVAFQPSKCEIDGGNETDSKGKQLDSTDDLLSSDALREILTEAEQNEVTRRKKASNTVRLLQSSGGVHL